MASQQAVIRRLELENARLRRANARAEEEAARLRGMWSVGENADRLDGGRGPQAMHELEWMEAVIADGAKLSRVTTLRGDQFERVAALVTAELLRPGRRRPRFRDEGFESGGPGNMNILYVRHAVLVALMYYKSNVPMAALGVIAGVSAASICRYVRLVTRALAAVLPTASRIAALIRRARTAEELRKIVPRMIMIIDATHVRTVRPGDEKARKRRHSGRKKAFTFNTTVVTDRKGNLIGAGRPAPGSTHDLTALRKDPLPFGRWAEKMEDKDTAGAHRVQLYADKGYAGLDGDMPGADHHRAHRKHRDGSPFTPEEEEHNWRVNRTRIRVEHGIGRLKQYRRLTAPYAGTARELALEMDVISGLVNLRMNWRDVRAGRGPYAAATGRTRKKT